MASRDVAPPPQFTCPICSSRSSHPRDLAEGYCGHCRSFTGKGELPARPLRFPEPPDGTPIALRAYSVFEIWVRDDVTGRTSGRPLAHWYPIMDYRIACTWDELTDNTGGGLTGVFTLTQMKLPPVQPRRATAWDEP